MKITAIDTVTCETYPNMLWIQIHTDTGYVGLGETICGRRRNSRERRFVSPRQGSAGDRKTQQAPHDKLPRLHQPRSGNAGSVCR